MAGYIFTLFVSPHLGAGGTPARSRQGGGVTHGRFVTGVMVVALGVP